MSKRFDAAFKETMMEILPFLATNFQKVYDAAGGNRNNADFSACEKRFRRSISMTEKNHHPDTMACLIENADILLDLKHLYDVEKNPHCKKSALIHIFNFVSLCDEYGVKDELREIIQSRAFQQKYG